MTSSLGVSGPCAPSVCPSDWGSTLPWEGPLGLVLAPWLRGSSALPCLQHPSSWKGNGGGWGAAWPPAGCFDAQEILFFCERISVSLWKLMQLWKVTCLVMVQQHVSLQSDRPQAVQQHHEPGSCLEFCIVLALNLHFSGLFFLLTSFQVGFLAGKRMCSPTNTNVILWLWV